MLVEGKVPTYENRDALVMRRGTALIPILKSVASRITKASNNFTISLNPTSDNFSARIKHHRALQSYRRLSERTYTVIELKLELQL